MRAMLGRLRRCVSRRVASLGLFLPLVAICLLGGPARSEVDEVPDPHVAALSESYRELFATLAQGDRTTALARTAAFETRTLAADPDRAIEWLSQADRLLLDEYVLARPQCALPLALFYQRLALAHAAEQRYSLSQRALHVADGLYGQMALAARSAGERRLTAAAYAGLAADLLTLPAPVRAAEMLGRGLLLMPDDADSGVALAVLLLRDRQPAAAAERFDRVLRSHPDNREARLRRALMRAGLAAESRTARELEALATGKEDDWIALIATQECARRLLASGDYDRAIAFLKQSLDRFPSDSALRVALAFAAARSGRRAEAQSAVESALAVATAPGESARRRFGELPYRLLTHEAALAEEAADERTPILAAAISSAAGPSALTPGSAPGGELR